MRVAAACKPAPVDDVYLWQCYAIGCAEEVGHIHADSNLPLAAMYTHATQARSTRYVFKSSIMIRDIAKIVTNLLWIVCASRKHMA